MIDRDIFIWRQVCTAIHSQKVPYLSIQNSIRKYLQCYEPFTSKFRAKGLSTERLDHAPKALNEHRHRSRQHAPLVRSVKDLAPSVFNNKILFIKLVDKPQFNEIQINLKIIIRYPLIIESRYIINQKQYKMSIKDDKSIFKKRIAKGKNQKDDDSDDKGYIDQALDDFFAGYDIIIDGEWTQIISVAS